MFPSFTGSARSKRQVNLSGRNSNPFAALPGSRITSSPQSAQNAVAQAQQERILRQQERERPPAATRIQKTWRGHKSRKEARKGWRQEWDDTERWDTENASREFLLQSTSASEAYASEKACLNSLRLLVHFASPRNDHDIKRMYYFASRYFRSTPTQSWSLPADLWTHPLLRLAKLILATLNTKRHDPLPYYIVDGLLALLNSLAVAVPNQLAPYSHEYFRTLARVAVSHQSEDFNVIKTAAIGLLRATTMSTDIGYEGFASEWLTTPELPTMFGSLEGFARGIDYRLLANASIKVLSPSSRENIIQLKSRESLLWFLAYFVYFRRWTYSEKPATADSPDAQYVKIVSRLISFLADDIGTRVDASDHISLRVTERPVKPLPPFVRFEILTLINQRNVSSLLANIDVMPGLRNSISGTPDEASALASYALTLLRAFPRRGDEIRMWLYRGSTSRQSQAIGRNLPAIKYLYHAASSTNIYKRISKDPHETVAMLRPDKAEGHPQGSSLSMNAQSRNQQWRIILLFLELYTFVVKVMDDEDFLSGTSEFDASWSWTRQSALPLDQVKSLTIFLKCLAFSMYYHWSEIAGIEATDTKTSLAEYFGSPKAPQSEKRQEEQPVKFTEMSVAGVSGMTLAYMKGMVTGVLRMIYERE